MNSTLDEWEVLYAVVQLGGFAPAAEHLHRSQSTLSYAIARLQARLGIKLLELKGRKAHLTEAGRALLADAEPHLAEFHQLEQRARALASGGASDVRLSVDSIYPNDRLFAALRELTRRFPVVLPHLRQATFLSAETEFSAHGAHLCVAAADVARVLRETDAVRSGFCFDWLPVYRIQRCLDARELLGIDRDMEVV